MKRFMDNPCGEILRKHSKGFETAFLHTLGQKQSQVDDGFYPANTDTFK